MKKTQSLLAAEPRLRLQCHQGTKRAVPVAASWKIAPSEIFISGAQQLGSSNEEEKTREQVRPLDRNVPIKSSGDPGPQSVLMGSPRDLK